MNLTEKRRRQVDLDYTNLVSRLRSDDIGRSIVLDGIHVMVVTWFN